MAKTVAIVDYGLGNLGSVSGALEKIGAQPLITRDPVELERADKLILPGVGAFGDGMARLRQHGLVEVLNDLVLVRRRPILGICLGCQLFARTGTEFGNHPGLGWVDAEVRPITPSNPSLRVPHVGWNDLIPVRPSLLLNGLDRETVVYFVHSYHVVFANRQAVVAETEYADRLTAAYECDNIFATQFHPEKSQRAGLTILENFVHKA